VGESAIAVRESSSTSTEPFFELSLDPLLTAGFDGYIKRASPAWERTLGWTEAELTAVPYTEFIHPEDRERALAEVTALATGAETKDFELRVRGRDGAYRELLFNAVGVPDGGVLHAVAKDITHRGELRTPRRRPRALQRRARALRVRRLARPLRAAAHGQRLRLAPADPLRRPARRRRRGVHSYIVDGVDRMQALIRDLLTYSRVGRAPLELEAVAMGPLVERVLEGCRPRSTSPTRASRSATADRARRRHPAEPARTEPRRQRAEVHRRRAARRPRLGRARGQRVGVRRGRRGHGIDRQYDDRIFQVFQRLHAPNEYPGTGVGLAICRAIADRHGGRIWVESAPGEGSVFRFTLPAE
jgi:PAS domain S-box-containing protein